MLRKQRYRWTDKLMKNEISVFFQKDNSEKVI